MILDKDYYFQFVGTFSLNTKAMKCVQNNVHDSSDIGSN